MSNSLDEFDETKKRMIRSASILLLASLFGLLMCYLCFEPLLQ